MGATALRKSVFLALLSLPVHGCSLIVASPPWLFQSEFDDQRVELKREVAQKLISAEQAEGACLLTLRHVHHGYAASPPYPDEICTFGSFADRRYELTKAFNQGVISQESWERECLALPGRPENDASCHLDQLGEMLVVWHQQVQRGDWTEEAVQRDCLNWVASHGGDDVAKERCQIKRVRNEP